MHEAMHALNMGDEAIAKMSLLSNTENPPTRRVKANGKKSDPFHIRSGVPQGCPFSPLAFLLVAEALTRTLEEGVEIDGQHIRPEGIQITDPEDGSLLAELAASLFADDTQALLKNYAQIDMLWKILQIYEEATGMRANPNKFEGIRLGPLKHQPPPTLNGRSGLKWLEKGSYTKRYPICL